MLEDAFVSVLSTCVHSFPPNTRIPTILPPLLPPSLPPLPNHAEEEEPLHIDTGDQMKVKQVLDEAVVKAIVDAGYEGMLIVRVWWGNASIPSLFSDPSVLSVLLLRLPPSLSHSCL